MRDGVHVPGGGKGGLDKGAAQESHSQSEVHLHHFTPGSLDFDGKIRIWRVCITKEEQQTTVWHTKSEEYEVEVIVDTEWYLEWYTEGLLRAIKEKILWLESGETSIQQDGMISHTGKGTVQNLDAAGMEEG
ncbi:unnamed protein product [Choristocarpus tenellus]